MQILFRVGHDVAVVCNPIWIDRRSEFMVVCVCHSDEMMRTADANETSGELVPGVTGSHVEEHALS